MYSRNVTALIYLLSCIILSCVFVQRKFLVFGENNILKLLAKPYNAVINFKHPFSGGYHSNREKV